MRKWLKSIGLRAAVGVVLSATLARADARTEARSHFRKGMEAISASRFEEGVSELEQAYAILPHPNVLYNIARAKTQLGDLRGAISYFRRYLEGDPSDRDEVLAQVVDLERRLAKEQATPEPQPATEPEPSEPSAPPKPQPVTPPPPMPVRAEDVFREKVSSASKASDSPLDSPNSTSIITEQDIRLSGITKIPELLRRLAGIEIMQVTGSQTEVSIRGFNQRLSNKVLVLIDGRSVYGDFIGAVFWQTFPIAVEDIQQIEIVRGPGSALYGAAAFNGVINILTKRPSDGKGMSSTLGVGSLGTTHASAWAATQQDRFGFRLSAGYDYLPRWSREVPDNRTDARLSVRDQNESARTMRIDARSYTDLGHDTELGIGGGHVQGSLETLGVGSINSLVLPTFRSSDASLGIKSKVLESHVYYTRFDADLALNAASVGQTLLPSRAEQNVLHADSYFKVPLDAGDLKNRLTLGAVYRYKNVDFTFLDHRRVENHGSFFLENEARIGKYLAVILDYRADYIPYLSRLVHSPRAAALVHPTKLSTIRGSFATAFRPPTFLEAYLDVPLQLPVTGGALFAKGDSRVEPENVFSAELGYLSQDLEVLNLDLSLYYNRVTNLIQLADARAVTLSDAKVGKASLDPESGLFPLYYGGFANQCQRYNVLGGEVGFRTFPAQGFDVYGNYTLHVAGQDDDRCKQGEAPLSSDSRTSLHKANVGVQVRTAFGLDGAIDFHVVAKQSWRERVVDTDAANVVSADVPLSAYSLLNARVGYRFYKDHYELSLSGFNLANVLHREHPFGQLVGRRVMGFVTVRY